MAAATKTVTIRFNGDPSGLTKASSTAQNALTGLGAKFGSALRGMATVAGGVLGANLFSGAVQGVRDFVGGSVTAFSDLQQAVGGVDSVFGEMSGRVHKFAETSADSVGLSAAAFQRLAGPLGGSLKLAGFSMDQVSAKTVELTQRAADMAATFGGTTSQALEAIQSALRGELDPIERYAVGLNAAKVEAAALAATGKKAAKDLTDQEKATARLNLIMSQTAGTAGQFAREVGTIAGQQERAAAKTEDLQAKIGKKLAPVVAKVTELKLKLTGVIVDKVLPTFDRLAKSPLADWIKTKLVPAVADFGRWLVTVGEKVVQFGQWLNEHRDVLLALAIGIAAVLVPAFIAWAISAGAAAVATIAATLPILLIVAAVALLAFGIIKLVQNWDTIWGHIWSFMKMIGAWFAGPFAGFFVGLRNGIVAGVVGTKNWIVNTFNTVVGFLVSIPARIGSAARGMWDGIKDAFRAAINWIIDKWNGLRFGVPAIDIPGLGKVGGSSFGVPQIPRLATGGHILQTGLALVHKGETVVPAQAAPLGPEVLELHLDLGHGIQQVVQINLREHNRGLKRRATAGTGAR